MLKYKYSNKINVQKDIESGLVVRLDNYYPLRNLFFRFKKLNGDDYYRSMYYNLYFPFILSDPDILNSTYRVYLCNGDSIIISNDRSKINSIDPEDTIINTVISDINNINISFGISNIRLYENKLEPEELDMKLFDYEITLYSYNSAFVIGLNDVCRIINYNIISDGCSALIGFDLELPYGTKYTDLRLLYDQKEMYSKDYIYSNNRYLFSTIMTNRDRLILVSELTDLISDGNYELRILK